ncbi:antitoxin [Aeromicrobium sp. SMF47]|uniref:Antitoxin n=1 Tax=Aeromicrobium yanjiei TaxID=2662028 RepID=A0A5Q2MFF5_9ACTN|nr:MULTISPECIES: antitoxin [Aeromicrobium]MRJ77009.1 antitoxin [Aeromicrobium yanjiei]MRK01351.1 antitoxin [Aeromicrobium sp. S22]QGG41874.1 antitoxin [Aeromicrobium yanjiei]
MGFLDKLTKRAPELREKAADLAATHHDKIEQGIDKAADLADRATKGKHTSKVDGAAAKAKEAADKLGEGRQQ